MHRDHAPTQSMLPLVGFAVGVVSTLVDNGWVSVGCAVGSVVGRAVGDALGAAVIGTSVGSM